MSYSESTIKSLQRGTITGTTSGTSWTATISSVDTDKAIAYKTGNRTELGNATGITAIILTNGTTVTMSTGSQPTNYSTVTPFTVVEYY
jgi:hypothetical protein